MVQSNEHTPTEPFSLKVLPSISLAGERMVPIKHMDFLITDNDGKVLANEAKPELEFQFQPGKIIDLNVSFNNPGQLNFVVRCNFIAELETQ